MFFHRTAEKRPRISLLRRESRRACLGHDIEAIEAGAHVN
jgi:hypothetical protein